MRPHHVCVSVCLPVCVKASVASYEDNNMETRKAEATVEDKDESQWGRNITQETMSEPQTHTNTLTHTKLS